MAVAPPEVHFRTGEKTGEPVERRGGVTFVTVGVPAPGSSMGTSAEAEETAGIIRWPLVREQAP